MPCSGPRTLPCRRSASSRRASARAFGLSRTIAVICGPCRSYAAIRARYALTSASDVVRPLVIAAWRSVMLASYTSTAAGLAGACAAMGAGPNAASRHRLTVATSAVWQRSRLRRSAMEGISGVSGPRVIWRAGGRAASCRVMRTSTIAPVALVLSAVALAPAPTPRSPAFDQQRAQRPNIVFIMSDDHAAHAISATGRA